MEKAFLVGVNLNDGEDYLLSLEELDALAQACDMEVVGIAEQTLPEVHKAYYIGTGKVDEVKETAMDCGADVIIFDNSLSPMQLRNLQERLEKPVLDRSTLILDILQAGPDPGKRNCRWRWQDYSICCPDLWGCMRRSAGRAAAPVL